MALQVVSILSSSKGDLENDENEPSSSQKSANQKGADATSAESKFGSSKYQLSPFGKTGASKSAKGPTAAEGGVAGTAGEVTPLNKYFTNFMVELLRMFDTDRTLLENKGSFVIRSVSRVWSM